MAHEIEWRCPACLRPGQQEIQGRPGLHCPHCGHRREYTPGTLRADGTVTDPLERCICCGYDRLFAQKDFNRKIGVAVVLVGAVLSPWTYGLSLLACMALDYGLYHFVPEITVCYGCDAIHRGFEHNPLHRAHDPLLADRYRREAPAWLPAESPPEGSLPGAADPSR